MGVYRLPRKPFFLVFSGVSGRPLSRRRFLSSNSSLCEIDHSSAPDSSRSQSGQGEFAPLLLQSLLHLPMTGVQLLL